MRLRSGLAAWGMMATCVATVDARAAEPPLAAHRLPLAPGPSAPSQRLTPTAMALPHLPRTVASPAGSFVTSYLAPQIARRLGPVGEILGSPAFEHEPVASTWRAEVSRDAERRVWKATRKAVRSYLGDRFDPGVSWSTGLPTGATSIRGGTRLRLGVANLRPRLLMERSAGAGAMRLSLDVVGDVKFEWRPGTGDMRLGASFDPSARLLNMNLGGSF